MIVYTTIGGSEPARRPAHSIRPPPCTSPKISPSRCTDSDSYRVSSEWLTRPLGTGSHPCWARLSMCTLHHCARRRAAIQSARACDAVLPLPQSLRLVSSIVSVSLVCAPTFCHYRRHRCCRSLVCTPTFLPLPPSPLSSPQLMHLTRRLLLPPSLRRCHLSSCMLRRAYRCRRRRQ